MNDQYVGDVGDFAKFGLLRHLLRHAKGAGLDLRPGVVWYATRDAGGAQGDGRHIGYLTGPKARDFQQLDPELHSALGHLVQGGRRTIQALESAGLLPAGTAFHSDVVDGPRVQRTLARDWLRNRWLECGREATKGADLVFLDPDNGLASPTASITRASARKSAFLHEVQALASPKQSLVLYHHQTRQGDAHAQARTLVARLSAALPHHLTPKVVRFTRGSSRFFVLVAAHGHAVLASEATTALVEGPWGRHFVEVV